MSDSRKPLTTPDELLHRQVHPSHIQDGELTSAAFKPFPKDRERLSVDRDTLSSAKESYLRHTQEKRLESAGTWSVSVEECLDLSLPAIEDPVEIDGVSNLAHCLICFDAHSSNQQRRKAKKLRDKAVARKATYTDS